MGKARKMQAFDIVAMVWDLLPDVLKVRFDAIRNKGTEEHEQEWVGGELKDCLLRLHTGYTDQLRQEGLENITVANIVGAQQNIEMCLGRIELYLFERLK